MTNRPKPSSPYGFTLIELLVVLVIIAVVLGAAAPRLAAISGGKTRTAAQQVAGLLSAVARREQLSSQPICIDFDVEQGRLSALSKKPASTGLFPDWTIDPLVPGVDLALTPPTLVTLGDDTFEPSRFRIDLRAVSPRPSIRIAIQGDDAATPVTVVLPAGRLTARIAAANEGPEVDADVSIDLDAAGRGDDAW
ncbi:MAG: prepilin-type N-terminal cleavage/methylation domain-containing protein [bacterium]|nr:prepilin-type N-terminal cleavage/methylation domain-containing protein [bacterium]